MQDAGDNGKKVCGHLYSFLFPEGACTDDLVSRKPGFALLFCRSLGFLVPLLSFFTDKTDLADFVCYVWRRRWGGGGVEGLCLFVCKNYISLSLISLNIFLAMFNFDEI